MATKCVIYRRFSSDEQGKGQGDTLATQLDACEAYARRKGWDVLDVLTDDGFSAYKGEHLQPPAALAKFVQHVHAGEVERGTVLLAFKQNRLSRLPPDQTMVWIYGLTSRGIGIAICDTDRVFEANPPVEDYLGMAIRAAVANKESADKSDLVIKAKLKMWEKAERKEGKWVNLANRPPLWLKRNEERNGWTKDDHRVEIINKVYKWAADGMGAVTIAKKLNELSEPPWGKWRKTPGWGRTAIKQMIDNPAVEGDLVPEAGVLKGRVMHDFYPRIVEPDLVARARAGQKSRKKAKGRSAPVGTLNLFAGVIACGDCGRRAYLSTTTNRHGKRFQYLRCENVAESRCKNGAYYPYAAFEAAAMDLCLDLALDDRFFEAKGELHEARNRVALCEKMIGDKRAHRKLIMANFRPNDPDAIEIANELLMEIDVLNEQLTDAKAAVERASGKVGAAEHLRRVNDIRDAAMSDDPVVREEARSKLRIAFGSILNKVEISQWQGEKVFTVSFLGGVLAVRMDMKGNVTELLTDALGKPLWEHLPEDQRGQVEPLVRRIQNHATAAKLAALRKEGLSN